MAVLFVHKIHAVEGVTADLLSQEVRMGWTVSKTFGCQSVNEVLNGFNIGSVV